MTTPHARPAPPGALVLAFVLALVLAVALAGCSLPRFDVPAKMFDLGPPRAVTTSYTTLPPLAIADVSTAPSLDRPQMFYRLDYANPQQPLPYAQSRWSAPPAQLLTQRIKARITLAGGTALSASDGANNVPELRIEADEFTQRFSAPDKSTARIALRASLYRDRTLVGQTQILREAPAITPDAEGGAQALVVATDAAIDGLIAWLASHTVK